jgi:hypothetical protein
MILSRKTVTQEYLIQIKPKSQQLHGMKKVKLAQDPI